MPPFICNVNRQVENGDQTDESIATSKLGSLGIETDHFSPEETLLAYSLLRNVTVELLAKKTEISDNLSDNDSLDDRIYAGQEHIVQFKEGFSDKKGFILRLIPGLVTGREGTRSSLANCFSQALVLTSMYNKVILPDHSGSKACIVGINVESVSSMSKPFLHKDGKTLGFNDHYATAIISSSGELLAVVLFGGYIVTEDDFVGDGFRIKRLLREMGYSEDEENEYTKYWLTVYRLVKKELKQRK